MPPVHPGPGAVSPQSAFVPDHELLHQIGKGSYGEVWLARSALGTFRAVKFVWKDHFKDAVPFERELRGMRKFEPVSRSHPGFVHILQVGHDPEGRFFYYVMELGDDVETSSTTIVPESYKVKTIEEFLRLRKLLPADEVLWLGLRLSDALHQLHLSGLVHRDIKPANILFVGGLPKLADIGLVTDLGDASTLVGTLGYIPAEGPGSVQADTFALGKVLYECLTGFDRTCFPNLPTFLDEFPDKDRFLEINEAILKACHPVARLRYATARQFHGELAAIENGKSLRRLRELESKWNGIKRIAMVAGIAIVLGATAIILTHREMMHRQVERQRVAGSLSATAARAINERDYATALRSTARMIENLPEDRSEPLNRFRYGSILGALPKLTFLRSCGSTVSGCEFTPDDRQVLVALADGRCELIDPATGTVTRQFQGASNGLLAAAISLDGKRVGAGGPDGTAWIWDIESGKNVFALRHPDLVATLRFSPDGKGLATGCADGFVRLWSVESGKMLRETRAHHSRVDCVEFSNSGKTLVSGGRDGRIRWWDAGSLESSGEGPVLSGWVLRTAFSPDDRQLVAACTDKAAHLWSLGETPVTLPALHHDRIVRHAEFSPDGRHLLTAGWDDALRVWLPSTGQLDEAILHHGSPVNCAGYSHDGRRVVSGCTDGSLRVWDFAGKSTPQFVPAQTVGVDGRFVAVMDHQGVTIRSLGVEPEQAFHVAVPDKLRRLFLSDEGKWLASVYRDGANTRVRLREVATATNSLDVSLTMNPSRSCWDSKGKWIALADSNHLDLVSLQKGAGTSLVRTNLRDFTLSADGGFLALAFGRQVEILSTSDKKRVGPLLSHSTTVQRIEFSPSADRLLACTSDPTLNACYAQVWEVSSGRPVSPRLWHQDGIKDGAWFPDGKQIVTASEDGTARIWEVANGRQTGTELAHRDQILDLDLGWNSRLILTASLDSTVRLWDPETSLPVGPPVQFPSPLQSGKLVGAGPTLLGKEMNGATWMKSAAPIPWDTPVLKRLSELLSGKIASNQSQEPARAAEDLAREWAELKSAQPRAFTVTTNEIIAWHRFEAQACSTLHLRDSEAMHLRRLLALDPDDSRSLRRKETLETPSEKPPSVNEGTRSALP